jgi:hypothetical protein
MGIVRLWVAGGVVDLEGLLVPKILTTSIPEILATPA